MGGKWKPPPHRPQAKPWFCVAGAGGGSTAPPATPNTGKACSRSTLRKPLVLCRWRGHAPPLLRQKNTVVCRKQSSGHKSMIYCSINHSSWHPTLALCQKLRLGQTSTVDSNEAFGMGLHSKLKARDPIVHKTTEKYAPRTSNTYIYIYTWSIKCMHNYLRSI